MSDTSASVSPIRPSAWGTTDSSYSREDFYTGAKSPDGSSTTKSIAFPAHVMSQLAALIQSGRLPYRTVEDFFRDAAHHRLHDLDEMGVLDHDASRRVALWRRQEELDRRVAEIAATEVLISDTKALVERATDARDWVLLEQVVRDSEATAEGLHEPWRGKLLRVVEGALGESDG